MNHDGCISYRANIHGRQRAGLLNGLSETASLDSLGEFET